MLQGWRLTRARPSTVAGALLPIIALTLALVAISPSRVLAACGDGVPDGGSCGVEAESADVGSAPPSETSPASSVGNPVNLFTGNKRQQEGDYRVPGSELVFNRTYNSANSDWNAGVGEGWHHSYAVSLFDAGNGARDIVQSDGRRLHFKPAGKDAEGRPLWRSGQAHEGLLVGVEDEHRWRLPDGRSLRFRGSFLVEIDWPDQRRLALYYREKRLAWVRDETGRELTFAYIPGRRGLEGYDEQRFGERPGLLRTVMLPDGSALHYDYDQRDNLTRVRYPNGTAREYHYEDERWPSHLTGLTERTGVRFASWTYDSEGRAVSSEHAGGVEKVTLVYPDASRVASGTAVETVVTNSLGDTSTYRWVQPKPESEPQLLSSTGAGCATCPPTGVVYDHDQQGRLVSVTTTGEGTGVGIGTREYVYDEAGRIVEIYRTTADGTRLRVEGREYAGASVTPLRTMTPSVNPDGEHVVETVRDANGLPLRVTERGHAPVGASVDTNGLSQLTAAGFSTIERTTTFEYESGRLMAIDGPREDVSDITRFGWDENQRLASVQTPASPPLRLTAYDAQGRVIEFRVGADDNTAQSPVSLAYDSNGQVVRVEQLGRALVFVYDAEGRLSRYTNADGRTHTLAYDAAGRLKELVDAFGRRTDIEKDSEGRVVTRSVFAAQGELIRSLSILYDAQGRLHQSTEQHAHASSGNTVQQSIGYAYDGENRLATAMDQQSGDSVALEYNPFGQLARLSEGGEPSSEFEHDTAGQEVGHTDARANNTRYLKDDFGRVVRLISPDTGTTEYRYDAADNRVYRKDAEGVETRYRWDAANRMTLRETPEGESLYRYDSLNGKLIEATNSDASEHFDYNVEAQLIRHSRTIDGQTFVTAYDYSSDGRLLRKHLPDGQQLRYHYHELGALAGTLRAITRESLMGLRQETLVGEIDNESRDGDSGHLSFNGVRTDRRFAADGSIQSIEIANTLALAYRYDEAGQIIGIDENGLVQGFGYAQGRLTHAETLSGTYRYTYDATGNRTAKSVEQVDGALTVERYRYSVEGEGNRLLERRNEADGEDDSYRYTATGAPTRARNGLRYEYNSEQRPVRVYENGSLLAEYAYNGFGERIRKVTYRGDQKRVTYFLYDGHKLTAEIDGENGDLSQTVFLGKEPVALLDGRETYAVHADHLGTPRQISNSDGETVWQASYTPFGEASITGDAITFNHRLPGQYADGETGTHYNYYRDYDPATGRYITSDPIGLKGGLNTYAYANSDPLQVTDVLGLAPGDETPLNPGTPTAPAADDEQSYADKLGRVIDYALIELEAQGASEVARQTLQSIQENIGIIAGIVAAYATAHLTGAGQVADTVLLIAAVGLAGYEGGRFVVNTIKQAWQLRNTELCDDAGLNAIGVDFANSVMALGVGLSESVLTGALSRLSRVARSVGDFVGRGALATLRGIRRLIGSPGGRIDGLSDLRRADGTSWWSMNSPVIRGQEFEESLTRTPPYDAYVHTPDNFGGVDWITPDGDAIDTFTMDLSTPARTARPSTIYQPIKNKIDGLIRNFRNPLLRDGEINQQSTNFTVTADDIDTYSVEVWVPSGTITQEARQAIDRAIEYGRQQGVEVRIMELE